MADKEQVAELAVTYAALILHDDNVAITVSSYSFKIIKNNRLILFLVCFF